MLDILLPPVDDLLEGGHAPQVQAVADHAGLQDVYVAVGKPRQDAAAAQVDFFRVHIGQGQGRLIGSCQGDAAVLHSQGRDGAPGHGVDDAVVKNSIHGVSVSFFFFLQKTSSPSLRPGPLVFCV